MGEKKIIKLNLTAAFFAARRLCNFVDVAKYFCFYVTVRARQQGSLETESLKIILRSENSIKYWYKLRWNLSSKVRRVNMLAMNSILIQPQTEYK